MAIEACGLIPASEFASRIFTRPARETTMLFPHFVGDGLWPAGRSHVAVGVTWAVRRHGIEIE
jgi:hypothetical protein